jgi:predicted O-linked N-acetylglucosamine transferase (SPINDLY family)
VLAPVLPVKYVVNILYAYPRLTSANDRHTTEGLAALKRGQLREAELLLRSAVNANPRNAEALHGLAIVAHSTGNYQPAIDLFDRAIAVVPGFAAAFVNRGNALYALQRFDEAIQSHKTALQFSPGLTSAQTNLASALQARGRTDEAVHTLESALASNADSPEILNNLGNLYKEQGRLKDAIHTYDRALQLDPMMAEAASNRLAAMKLDVSLSPADLLDKHREWSDWFEGVMSMAPLLTNTPEPTRRLRLGYVSPDCHTALPPFIDAVLAAHDRTRFEVFCYFNNPQKPESLAARNVARTSRVIKGGSDEAIARLIHDDGIDILIDIAGHTGHNRLQVFARRPAPVQVTWLDYLGTTGLRNMDYRITDAVADPPGTEAFHSEKLLRMPDTQWCWQPDIHSPDVSPLPAQHHGHVTFGSCNNAIKLTDATLHLWRQLLAAIPNSRLLLAGIAEGFARQRICDLLQTEAARIEFLPRVSVAEYRQIFSRVDVALDPMPFSGATTTLDALWQGVPVLTLPRATSCSRSTASILTALDLRDWIASDADDWLARAQHLCASVDALASLRAHLRERVAASSITDVAQFTRALEAHFDAIWRDWCKRRVAADESVARGEIRTTMDCKPALSIAEAELQRVPVADGTLNQAPLEAATSGLTKILRVRPNWEIAKKAAAQAYLSWAKFHPEANAAWRMLQPATVARTKVSAIICSIRPEYFAHIKSRLTHAFAAHDFEVIGIHDAKSICEAYNRGAAKAKGDVLIFCHDDIELVHDDFAVRLLTHLQRHDVIGVAGTSRLVNGDWGHGGLPHNHGQIIHRPPDEAARDKDKMRGYIYLAAGLQQPVMTNVQALDGVFIATHRHVWAALKFDEETFNGFHLYDIDFTYRAYLAGYTMAIPLDLLLIHFSTGRYDRVWMKHNLKFLAKFPALSNRPNVHRFSSCHVKVQTLDQVERLSASFLFHRFGTIEATGIPVI